MIMEVLYPEYENPTSAIKYSVFRLRKELNDIAMFHGKEVIITKNHGYRISQEIVYTLDLREFEEHWKQTKNVEDLSFKEMKVATQMIALYEGKMYVTPSNLLWFSNLCEYYRSIYAKCVMKACKKLLKKQKYDDMLQLDYKEILLELFYEGLHYYYMCDLIKTKDYHNALKYYDDYYNPFIGNWKQGFLHVFKELYDVIVQDSEESSQRVDTKELLESLFGNPTQAGCYYWTFDMFKYLFEISLRSAKRDHKEYYLILFELNALKQ